MDCSCGKSITDIKLGHAIKGTNTKNTLHHLKIEIPSSRDDEVLSTNVLKLVFNLCVFVSIAALLMCAIPVHV